MNILINGIKNDQATDFSYPDFSLKDSFLLTTDRNDGQVHTIKAEKEDLVQIIFEDDIEWFGFLGDIPEILSNEKGRGADPDILVISSSSMASGSRGGIGRALLKIFNVFSRKSKVEDGDLKELALKIDEKIMPEPGLFLVDEGFGMKTPLAGHLKAGDKYLLLLHGTFSSTRNSFADLNGKAWKDISTIYSGRTIALDHYTVSKSPVENAIDVLEKIPPNLKLDILSTSRGGLVADILARCDRRNSEPGFSKAEIEILEKNEVLRDQLNKLNKLAREKSLEVNNQIRIACPAGGTLLLTDRLDHFLNFLLGGLGLALGRISNAYRVLRECVMEIIAAKADVRIMPGLWAQAPGSDFQKANNHPGRSLATRLYIIAGDAEAGGTIGNSLKVLFTNLYFSTQNDFVVNTDSMKKGLARTEKVYYYFSQTNTTNHFSYFRNENSLKRVIKGLENDPSDPDFGYEELIKVQAERGINLTSGFKPYNKNNVSGTKPIIILLPGIMGSTLANGTQEVWLDFWQISRGKLVSDLHVAANGVSASGIVPKFYEKIVDYFSNEYDIRTFPFDWRLSLKEAAKDLEVVLKEYEKLNQPIKIIAHSMGGLVVRQLMLDYKPVWDAFISKPGSQFVMLGTPWKGSYLIMEVLTGHSKKVKLLKNIDITHEQIEIMKVISRFPGLYELLPIDSKEFGSLQFWQDISEWVGSGQMDIPDISVLRHFNSYKKQISPGFANYSFDNIYYIAGHAETVSDFEKKDTVFRGKYLRYGRTDLGDGSVTWKLGIPSEMHAENLYYSETEHGNLANEPVIFDALKDLLKSGKTQKLSHYQPSSIVSDRGFSIYKPEENIFASDENDLDNIFLDTQKVPVASSPQLPLKISVLNADLRHASYPVMVGHFLNDGIYSAEKALDACLKNKLSMRHKVGLYPQQIGESEVTYQKDSRPKGALVVGMGQQGELTPYKLMTSVQFAILKYAFYFKDASEGGSSEKNGRALSSIMIGSAFGGLNLSDSIRAVIQAVRKANRKITEIGQNLDLIREIEFIDYYEEIAQQTYAILKELEQENRHDHKIEVTGFKKGHGSRKRTHLVDSSTWWYTFTTESVNEEGNACKPDENPTGLRFTSSTGFARVEKKEVEGVLTSAEGLAGEFSHLKAWNPELSKVLFELLVPNDFKNSIRNQNNIIWKMDKYTAQFPWEMLNDLNSSDEPGFVNTGIVRQLIVDEYRVNPVIVNATTALIVGDPDYTGTSFPQLPGAAAEALIVSQVLERAEFSTNKIINGNAFDILKELFKKNYKVMHFAAHGVYDKKRSGVVLGKGLYLSPGVMNQIQSLPEFVFVNCCFSGDVTELEDRYVKNRSKLASNIGLQLIQMGVKAVVVAGWAVDDAAAKTFADELYRLLLDGYEFGVASQRARRKCYENHPKTNTWGAYQCYGDHYYKLVGKNPGNSRKINYVMESQIMMDLENLLSRIKGQKVNVSDTREQLRVIRENAKESKLESAAVFEMYAFILAEIGEYDQTIDLLNSLRSMEKASFSVVSLEQFCSLRGKQMVKQFKDGVKFDDTALKNLFRDLEIILVIGTTSERLALIGSANKRAAIIDKSNKGDYLKRMRDNFFEAFKLIKSESLENTIYPLSNYLIAHILDAGFNENTVADDLGLPKNGLAGHLKDILLKLEEQKDNFKDYYSANAISKVILCQFLLNKKPVTFSKSLKESLMDSIDNYANMKHIQGEIEHLEFIIELLPDGNHKSLLVTLNNELIARQRYMGG